MDVLSKHITQCLLFPNQQSTEKNQVQVQETFCEYKQSVYQQSDIQVHIYSTNQSQKSHR